MRKSRSFISLLIFILHFLLRGSGESPHVERSYDKVSRREVGEGGRGGGERRRREMRGSAGEVERRTLEP
ncbi:hypothetical protein INR49_015567 [Caranx melampygus]|nr:hypothetical protein INR49_015567 [Caranx melampygus]